MYKKKETAFEKDKVTRVQVVRPRGVAKLKQSFALFTGTRL